MDAMMILQTYYVGDFTWESPHARYFSPDSLSYCDKPEQSIQPRCPSVQLKNAITLAMWTTEAKFTTAVATHTPWNIREDRQ